MSITKKNQRDYAVWLLTSPYVPFPAVVTAIVGQKRVETAYQGMRVDAANAILSKRVLDPRRMVALAVKAELDIAQELVDGVDAPKGWPGERCLAICDARVTAAKLAAKKPTVDASK